MLKQDELNRLRFEIAGYQLKLNKTEKVEKNTLNRLTDFDKQTTLIKKLVSQLNLQVKDNQRGIEIAKLKLHALENSLARLQEAYRSTITHMYMRGPLHDTELLLSSASLNQMFVRAKYLRAFTDRQKHEVDDIRDTEDKIRKQQGWLQLKLTQQQSVLAEKKKEENHLKVKTEEHKKLLTEVRKDKEHTQQQLEKKQAAMRQIENMIAQLIERERKKHAASDKHKTERHSELAERDTRTSRRLDTKIHELPDSPISQTAFGRLRGHLPWPVSAGSVVGSFGNQVHPTLGTVTINKGIDIGVVEGAAVKSVADGVVSMIRFIPGFGNLVLISHEDGFVTVYAHLSQVLAKENQKVSAGQKIATSGGGDSGSQIHFQIWREKSVQNPLNWLAKR